MGASKSPRAGARRQLIAALREIKSTTSDLIARWEWHGRSTVWNGGPPDERPRRAHEYPEMQRTEWMWAARQAEHAAARLTQLAIECRHMADVVRDDKD